jgi:hypothetical protein
MISSDLHGAEEPIRWLLGWQRQDRVVTSPCTEKKKTPSSGRFGRDLAYGDQPLADGTLTLMDWTPPRASRTLSEAEGSVLGLFGTLSRLQEPQGGQHLGCRMMILP